MKKGVYFLIALGIVIIAMIIFFLANQKQLPPESKEQACVNSGGIISTSTCCQQTGDFPDTCAIGACGCSLEFSHEVKSCDCGEGKCFDGEKCVSLS